MSDTGQTAFIQAELVRAYEAKASRRESQPPSGFKLDERQQFADRIKAEGATSLLEIGCGPGYDAAFFAAAGFQVTAIDATPGLVSLAKEKGVDARLLDVRSVDSLDETFDAIYTMNCLLHVSNAQLPDVLAGISRTLRPGGLMYFGTWGGEDFEGVWEKDSYTPNRFFSFRRAETLLPIVQSRFQLESYRRVFPKEGFVYHSLLLRNETPAGGSG